MASGTPLSDDSNLIFGIKMFSFHPFLRYATRSDIRDLNNIRVEKCSYFVWLVNMLAGQPNMLKSEHFLNPKNDADSGDSVFSVYSQCSGPFFWT